MVVFQGSKCSSGRGIGGLGWSHVRERTVSHEAWIGGDGRLVGGCRGIGAGRVRLLDGAAGDAAHGLGDHVGDPGVAGGQRQTREGTVYLTGVVDTEAARIEAGKIAWRTDGVRGVVNDLTVGERTVGSEIDDVMISSKVKVKLIANSDIKAGDIDVSSSQGVVTLIGRVSSERIKREAGRVAAATMGVKGVHNELLVGTMKY
ncbi:MAG: hypothetical protein B7Z61_10720 [Acidobacteria bacterium 37-71-11]|nr:MAG: hypothetical protein B7Z61_10720 [Acidobacteria bacterium 37-71-11]